jgi:hypothetical protein
LVLKEHEWFVPELARELGVRPHVVYAWIRKGRLTSRQVDGPQGRWIVHADASKRENLKAAVTEVHAQGSESA